MSKLGCVCGHTIVDQNDNLPNKAKFIRDQDTEKFMNYSNDIASFIEAIKDGRRDAWIKEYFSEIYPTKIDNSSVIFDIFSVHERNVSSDIYQCENCGRIKIQIKDTNQYSSFIPEDDRYKNIFVGLHQNNGA